MLALNKWGPAGWTLIHSIMMTSPEHLSPDERDDMLVFLRSLGHHLPCPRCRRHFLDFVAREATPDRLATRESLVCLMNDCHNEVNRRNSKPVFTLGEHYVWMSSGQKQTPHASDLPLRVAVLVLTLVFASVAAKKLTSHPVNPRPWPPRSARRPRWAASAPRDPV